MLHLCNSFQGQVQFLGTEKLSLWHFFFTASVVEVNHAAVNVHLANGEHAVMMTIINGVRYMPNIRTHS